MNFRQVGLTLAVVIWMGKVALGQGIPPSESTVVSGPQAFFEEWIQGHLELGLHFSAVSLREPNKWNEATGQGFVGTIGHLDEEQTFMPYNLTAAYFLNPYFGIDLQWEQLEAKAVTHTADHHVDGVYQAQGPSLLLMGRIPMEQGFIPYAGVGLNFPTVDFAAEDWWRLGCESPSSYKGNGKPYLGKTRHIATRSEAVACLEAALGVLWQFADHWAVDVNLRYLDLNAISHHYSTEENGEINDHGEDPIPLAYLAFGAGVVYQF
jgi:hypothetical protein